MKKGRRPPTRIVTTRTVYFGGRRPRSKQWSWWLIGAGVGACFLLLKAPVLALLIGTGVWYFWREKGGRRR
jgi:hypothetical protein